MKKALWYSMLVVLCASFVFGSASIAMSYPNKAVCSGCHPSSSSVAVTATQVANDGVNATYNVTVSNAFDGVEGWAVFSGTSNIANAVAASGTFVVPVGATYTVWGVSDATSGKGGSNSVSISPAGLPPAQTGTVKVTVKNAAGAGLVRATVTLTGAGTYTGKTDRTGVATIAGVPYGTYTMKVVLKGYTTSTSTITVGSSNVAATVTLQ